MVRVQEWAQSVLQCSRLSEDGDSVRVSFVKALTRRVAHDGAKFMSGTVQVDDIIVLLNVIPDNMVAANS